MRIPGRFGIIRRFGQMHLDTHGMVGPRLQAAQFDDPAALLDRFLQSAARDSGNIAQEAEHVEQVGLPEALAPIR